MEKEQKKINKYASRSQMVEDIITWNDFYGPATKEAAYKERFAEIHARLLRSDGAKFALVQLSGLEKDELRRILLNPYHGPFQQYKDLLKSQQKLLPELVEQMVNAAYERRLGARGLQQQVGRLFQEQFLQQSVQIEL